MIPNYKDYLIKLLCKNHKKKYCLLTGNATTALYLTLKSLPNNIKKIGIINNSCIHIPISIILAKKKIVFVDINLKNFSFDLQDLKKKEIDALIAVHSFGYKCDIEKIKIYAKKNNIFLIEDLAVAQGLDFRTKTPAGSFGDTSILSFGNGKVINAGGGGAVLTDDYNLYNKLLLLDSKLRIPKKINKIYVERLSKFHTKVYNELYINENQKNLIKDFKLYVKKNSKNFLFKFEIFRAQIIYKKTLKIKKYLNLRKKNYIEIYKKLKKKKNKKYNFLPIHSSFVPWRFNIFFKNNKDRNFVMRKLLQKKINISSWYSGLDIFFHRDKKLKNSEYLSKSILNIWINEQSTSIYRNKVVNFLLKL